MEKERTGITARSGDTHVIDGNAEHAEAVNIDALARDQAAAEPLAARDPSEPVKMGELLTPPAELLIDEDESEPRTPRRAK